MFKHVRFIISIIVIAFLLIGCAQSKDKHISDTVGQIQSNPFDTDNKELLFVQIENAIDSAIKARGICYQENTLKGYLVWDSVTYTLYSPYLVTHSSDSDWANHENGIIEYLNWHLRKTVNSLLNDKRIVDTLKIETTLTDSLLVFQYAWL